MDEINRRIIVMMGHAKKSASLLEEAALLMTELAEYEELSPMHNKICFEIIEKVTLARTYAGMLA